MLSPQPDNIAFLKRFRVLAYILVALAIGGFAYAEENPSILLLSLIGITLSWWLVETPNAKPLPRWVINVGVLIASLLLFYELVIYQQENLLRGLGHFMVAILLCKLFERKFARDYTQILTLTLLIMVASCIFSQSLIFGVILVAYLLLGLYMILVFHLHQETHNAALARQIPEDLTLLPERHDSFRTDVRRVSAYSVVALLLIASVVFMLFPRGKAHDLLASWAISQATRTGFSERVRFTDSGRIQQSEAVVMEVKLEQNSVNIGSEFYQPYFRGIALDTYDPQDRYWLRSPYLPPFPSNPSETQPIPTDNIECPLIDGTATLINEQYYNPLGVVSQEYTVHALSGNLLFTVSLPVSVSSEQFRTVNFAQRDLNLIVRGTIATPVKYTIKSAVLYKPDLSRDKPLIEPGDLGIPISGPEATPSRVSPEINRVAREVAREHLSAPGTTPSNIPLAPEKIRPIAETFENYLRQNYPYSLTIRRVDPNLDPTADFLLNRKATGGHCEYFASAMVMMCRSLGINARMVTGYHGGEYNSLGGFYVVKQKHAHAWVEVFLPNRGWTLYDPTPAGPETPISGTSSWSRWFAEVSEIVQKSWLNTVVSFDNTSRQFLFGTLGSYAAKLTAYFRGLLTELSEGLSALFSSTVSTPTRITGLFAILFVTSSFIWLLRSIHRRRTSHVEHILKNLDRTKQKQLALELTFFDELLRLLSRTGTRKLPEQTPREYVDTLAPLLKGATPDAHWLVRIFYDIRFGTLRSTPTLQKKIALALANLRTQTSRPTAN